MGQMFNLIGNGAATTTRVGGVAGGYFASNRAARKEGMASRETLDYGKAREEAALGYLDPYSGAGEEALSPLTGLLTGKQYNTKTGEYDPINEQQRMGLFQTSPGYQFRIDQAQKAIQNSQAARGNLLSGGALKELSQMNQGLAAGEYTNYIDQLMRMAGSGQQAAGQQASIVQGNTPGFSDLYRGGLNSTYEAQKWQNFSKAFQQGAEYNAQSHEKAGQSLTEMFGGGGGGGMGGMMGGMGSMGGGGAAAASDISLKENIEKVGESKSGIPIYQFEYKDKKYGEGRFEGVMAQDLLKSNASAILYDEDGNLSVDYSQIDVDFRRL